MSARAMQPASYSAPRTYHDFLAEDEDGGIAAEEFYAGEPIYPASHFSGRRRILRKLVLLSFICAAGWAWVHHREAVQSAFGFVASLLEQRMPAAEATAETSPVTEPQPLPEQERQIVEAPGAEAGEPAEPLMTGALPEQVSALEGEGAAEEEAVIEPLPPPKADPADPYQKRALAAGLHPDLSKSLLKRMTDADYKNASLAIKTALAETAEGGTYVWPREKAAANLAVFEVRFVKGAGSDCRRYVVTVTKDRWSTTAHAMEKCGADLPKRKMAKNAGRSG